MINSRPITNRVYLHCRHHPSMAVLARSGDPGIKALNESQPRSPVHLAAGGEYELQILKVSEMRESPDSDPTSPSSLFEEVVYPPRAPLTLSCSEVEESKSQRDPPLSYSTFKSFFDQDGRLVDEHRLRQAVFKGGVDPTIRKDVWRFLFGLYPMHSTAREREILQIEQSLRYRALKKRWCTILSKDRDTVKFLHPGYLDPRLDDSYGEDLEQRLDFIRQGESPEYDSLVLPGMPSPDIKQQEAFMDIEAQLYANRLEVDVDRFVSAIRVIDKDVPRTDRDCSYFAGADNPNLRTLRDVLMTFTAFHHKVSYAQGMNDILSRFLVVLDNEIEAYWCFTHYLENIQHHFLEDGLLQQLAVVRQLLVEIDPDLCHYLEMLGVGDMTFCHRWMLLSFKREFNQEDCLRCFEILSSHHMELSSMEAEKIRNTERRKDFANQGGKHRVEETPMNTDFTFDVFMSVTILVENRENIFRCTDTSDVFQLTCGLSNTMNLNELLAKAEVLFFKYCCRSVVDCFQMVDLPTPPAVLSQVRVTKDKSVVS